MAEETQHHGLVSRIRTAAESENFDLGGMNEAQVQHVLTAAFAEPFNLKDMIRLTFCVGGGKLVRQKYDDAMPKWCASALKSINFTEDKSASNDLSSAGCWKFHHDTGKNLKSIVVFPLIDTGSNGEAKDGEDEHDALVAAGRGGGGAAGPSERDLIVSVSTDLFPDMMKAKAPSWSQKQRALKDVLMPLQEAYEAIEARMIKGEQLSEKETAVYEETAAGNLREKAEWTQGEMKRQVEAGKLTISDRERLLQQNGEKIQSLQPQLEEARREDKAKKVQKLEEQLKTLEERRGKLEGLSCIIHPLKKEPDLLRLYRRVAVLDKERKGIKGRLLTVSEIQKFSEIDRLEEQIAGLVEDSRGFFETDAELEERAKYTRKKAAAGVKAEPARKPSAGGGAAAARSGSAGSWATAGGARSSRTGGKSGGGGSRGGSGNAFAALGDDSD